MIVPSDGELVDLAAATYAPNAVPTFHSFDQAVRVFVTLPTSDGITKIDIEGTHDPIGWAIDFAALPIEHQFVDHPQLGFIHSGFYAAAQSVLPFVKTVAERGPYSIGGHSLGAGMALELAGELTVIGKPPVKVGAFAPPRVGGDQFVAVIAALQLSGFRFGDDPVTEVPFTLPNFPYRQVPLTHVGPPATATDVLSLLPPEIFKRVGFHHIQNYVAAVHAIEISNTGTVI